MPSLMSFLLPRLAQARPGTRLRFALAGPGTRLRFALAGPGTRLRFALVAGTAALTLLALPGAGRAAAPRAVDETVLDQVRDRLIAAAPAGSSARLDPSAGVVEVRMPGTPGPALRTLLGNYASRVRLVDHAPAVTAMTGTRATPAGAGAVGRARYGPIPFRGGLSISDASDSFDCREGFVLGSPLGSALVITAGHCVTYNSGLWYHNKVQFGAIINEWYWSFPGDDFAAIVLSPANLAFYPAYGVQGPDSVTSILGVGMLFTNQLVTLVNSDVARSGSVTGLNVSISYGTGQVVDGLIETSVCAYRGESGSPLVTPALGTTSSYGLGVLSGGTNVSCSSGTFRSYFQPLDEVVARYSLTFPH